VKYIPGRHELALVDVSLAAGATTATESNDPDVKIKTGEYGYYCKIHPRMTGKVVVK
jgi:plastocyanin